MTSYKRLVNEELGNAGFAWVYTCCCDEPICERWKVLEYEVREAKQGLWSDPNPVPLREFRRKKRRK